VGVKSIMAGDRGGGLLLGPGQAPLIARPFYADGDPGPIVAVLAQVPELLEVAMPFLGAALGPSAIDWRTKEIVIVRTSALAGCRYCVQAHTVVALDAGLSRAEVRALRGETPVAGIFPDPREAALLVWVDAVADGGAVPDAARAAVRAQFADHEVVELTMLVGATLMLNRFATALALPTGPDTLARLDAEGLS
jgi:AhpD family alkylhydroperoxidase